MRFLSLKGPGGAITRERIPTFEEVVAFMRRRPDFGLALDIKHVDVAELGQRLVRDGLERRTTIFIGDPMNVERRAGSRR